MFRFFFLIILLLVIPDLYIWWLHTRPQEGVWRTVVLWLPTALTLGMIVLMLPGLRSVTLMQLAFILLVCVTVPKLAFLLVDVIGRCLVYGHPGALPFVRYTALSAALAVFAFQIYGTGWGWKRLQVAKTDIGLRELPEAFRGYRIVQISDLHVGTYGHDTTFVSQVVESVNRQEPDLIVFTGDLVNTESKEAAPFVEILSRLRAKDGVMSILGNHDYCIYQPGLTPERMKEEKENVVRYERNMGWQVLLNEHRSITRGSDTLWIAGVENVGKPPFPTLGNLDAALDGIPGRACTILLSHDPWHWRHGVLEEKRVSLTLSGHTHAMQLKIGNFSPASWVTSEWGGLYREEFSSQLYVSTGVGGSIPYRLGAWPQIEVITLK